MDARTDTDSPARADAPPPAAKRPGANRQRLFLILGAVIVIAALLWLLDWVFVGSHHVTTDDAYVNGNLVRLTPQVTGTVIAINTDETQFVQRGAVLVQLDQIGRAHV